MKTNKNRGRIFIPTNDGTKMIHKKCQVVSKITDEKGIKTSKFPRK